MKFRQKLGAQWFSARSHGGRSNPVALFSLENILSTVKTLYAVKSRNLISVLLQEPR
jgi:hypothetical protein